MPAEIEVFRTGTHVSADGRALSYSARDLEAIATAYDPEVYSAPLVVGHPKTDAPAYGWVKSLRFEDDKLIAEADDVDPDFQDLVKAGRYRNVSASFYLPNHKSNPSPGTQALRHVGFLGAKPPAVKGLKPVQFDEDEGEVVEFGSPEAAGWGLAAAGRLFRRMREWFIETEGVETADRLLPDYEVGIFDESARETMGDPGDPRFSEQPDHPDTDHPDTDQPDTDQPDSPAPEEGADHKETDMDPEKIKEIEQREADLKAREDRIAQQEADFAESEANRRHQENEAFVEALAAQGKFAPGHKAATVAFMDTLDHKDTVEFGEGEDGKQTPLAFFKDLLTQGGTVVDFSEATADDDQDNQGEADARTIAAQAVAYQEQEAAKGRKVGTIEAVAHVRAQSKG